MGATSSHGEGHHCGEFVEAMADNAQVLGEAEVD